MNRIFTMAVLVSLVAVSAMAPPQRGYVSGSFALYLDGTFAGHVNKMSGGFAEAQVIELLPPDDYYVKKVVDYPPGFKQITLVVGGGMTPAFYDWVRETLNGKYLWKDGAIVATDSTGKAVRTLEFYDAHRRAIGHPDVCDRVDRDRHSSRLSTRDGRHPAVLPSAAGDQLSEPVVQWYEEFAYNASNQERNGSIELLSSTLRDTILTMELHNLGAISVENVERDGSSPVLVLRMYSEFIKLMVASGC